MRRFLKTTCCFSRNPSVSPFLDFAAEVFASLVNLLVYRGENYKPQVVVNLLVYRGENYKTQVIVNLLVYRKSTFLSIWERTINQSTGLILIKLTIKQVKL